MDLSLDTILYGLAYVCAGLLILILLGHFPLQKKRRNRRRTSPGIIFVVVLSLFVAGLWSFITNTDHNFKEIGSIANAASSVQVTNDCIHIAQGAGYGNVELLCAFYHSQPPARANGERFPWYVAAAVVSGETNTAQGATCNPLSPSDCGRHLGWDLAPSHFPLSHYPAHSTGGNISNMALKCREGLDILARKIAHLYPGITGQNMYTSQGCSVGRTQILAVHFAPGGMFADIQQVDVWNNYSVTADLTYRHLAHAASPKCGGAWIETGNVTHALCSYNPNSWGVAEHQWYWSRIQEMSEKLFRAAH